MITPKHLHNRRLHLLLTCCLMIFAACGACNQVGRSAEGQWRTRAPEASEAPQTSGPSSQRFSPADGVLVFEASGPRAHQKVVIFDKNAKPLVRIDPDDDDPGPVDGEKRGFYPLFFSDGSKRDFGIQLRIVAVSKDWYEVVTQEGEDPAVVAYVRREDPRFLFRTWENWVLAHVNLRFDPSANPVLESPGGTAKPVSLPEEPVIKAERIKNDWVLVRWAIQTDADLSARDIAARFPANNGWIRWRRNGDILITDYFP